MLLIILCGTMHHKWEYALHGHNGTTDMPMQQSTCLPLQTEEQRARIPNGGGYFLDAQIVMLSTCEVEAKCRTSTN